jgi:hypothetical protein
VIDPRIMALMNQSKVMWNAKGVKIPDFVLSIENLNGLYGYSDFDRKLNGFIIKITDKWRTLPNATLQQTLLHELGHIAANRWDHLWDKKSIMYEFMLGNIRITDNDIKYVKLGSI